MKLCRLVWGAKNKEEDGMAKFCSNCGNHLGDGVQFCAQCGQRVSSVNTPKPTYQEPYKEVPKKKNGLKLAGIIAVIVLVLAAVFIGGVVYLFSQLSSDLDTRDFEGYYQGEMWVADIAMDGNDEMAGLLDTMKSIKMPMLVEIRDDATYDGVFIVKDPETMEDARTFSFGGEYDQILGDAEFGENEVLYLDGIVDLESDPMTMDGNIDLTNNETLHITAHYVIQRVDQLTAVDVSATDAAMNEAMDAYLNEMIEIQLGNDMDGMDMDAIEDNSGAVVEDPTDDMIPDDPLPYVDENLATGAWDLNIGGAEDHFIILGKGTAKSSFNEFTYQWDHPGYALFFLDEDVIAIPYEIQSDMLVIHNELYGVEDEIGVGYIKTDEGVYRLKMTENEVGSDVLVIEVEAGKTSMPGNAEKWMTMDMEASIRNDETLEGNVHLDFLNGILVDEPMTGQKIH